MAALQASPIAPYLTVSDGDGALQFYERAFDAVVDARMPSDDGRIMHASLTINGGTVMLSDDIMEGGGGTYAPDKVGGASVTIHIETPHTERVFAQAVGAGAEVVMPLERQFWGSMYGKVRDPFGHVWSIGGPADD